MHGRPRLIASALLFAALSPFASAHPAHAGERNAAIASGADNEASDTAAQLAAMQKLQQRYHALAWRLAVGNAPYCTRQSKASGLVLYDSEAFEKAEGIRRAAGLEGDIAVMAVAEGSPAHAAGLRPNDEIISLDGYDLVAFPVDKTHKWMRSAQLARIMDRALSTHSTLTLTVRRKHRASEAEARRSTGEGENSPQPLTLAAKPVCPSRWELLSSGDKAVADGARIVFGPEFPAFHYPDAELATAMAHELAHNLLGHRAWLDENGRSRAHIRITEREADRLMPWLIANAGFPPEAALSMMQKWGPKHSGGLFRPRSHDGWDERAGFIAAELPRIAAHREASGKADWARHFQRDIR